MAGWQLRGAVARDVDPVAGVVPGVDDLDRVRVGLRAGDGTGDTKALEKLAEEVLGLRADLQQTGKGEQCRLTLEIADYDQLDTVVERLYAAVIPLLPPSGEENALKWNCTSVPNV